MLIAGIVCKRSPSPIRGLPDRWIGDNDEGRLVAKKRSRDGVWEMRFLPRVGTGFSSYARAVVEGRTFEEAERLMAEALGAGRAA